MAKQVATIGDIIAPLIESEFSTYELSSLTDRFVGVQLAARQAMQKGLVTLSHIRDGEIFVHFACEL